MTIAAVVTHHGVGVLVTWAALDEIEQDGEPFEMPDGQDRCIQFIGTVGATGSIQMEGSNDGSNWHILTDPQGNAIVKTALDMEQVTEFTRYVRPYVTAGEVDVTDFDALLYVRRQR